MNLTITILYYIGFLFRENGASVWDLLDQGAHLYVCGDAKMMAKVSRTHKKFNSMLIHDNYRTLGILSGKSAGILEQCLKQMLKHLLRNWSLKRDTLLTCGVKYYCCVGFSDIIASCRFVLITCDFVASSL